MAETVNSQTQHIAALDFDITQAVRQLEQLQSRVEEITNLLNSQNWSVNATISGENGVRAYADELVNAQNRITALEEEIANMREQMEQASDSAATHTSELATIIKAKLVQALEDAAVAAAKAAQEVEDSMMDISRVLNLTSNQTENMRDEMLNLGTEFGRSFNEVSDVTLRFAQAGYNMQDSLSMTRDALLAVNTAELDSEQATQSLIGILNQWGYSADDLITVIDKLNYTADNNAITTQDLVDSLLKASSVAKTAGMSFDDTVGILTSMKVASGAAGKEVGNAFKSILSYIQRPDSLKLFDSMGIEVYADKATGALNPMMDILEQMSEKWNSGAEAQNNMIDTLVQSGDAAQMMSEEWAIASDSVEEYAQYQQAAAEATDLSNTAEARAQANAAAGVYRRNYYISLMENFSEAVRVSDDLINAEGHSMQENGRYMETLTAKIEQLKVSFTELAVAAADSGLMDLAKECIDIATAITKWTAESKNLIPILSSLCGVIITIKSQKIATEMTNVASAFKQAASAAASFGEGASLAGKVGWIGLIISAINVLQGAMNTLTQQAEEARQAIYDEATLQEDKAQILENVIDKYSELAQKYDELRNKTELTSNEEEELKSITEQLTSAKEQLTDVYGAQAKNIDLVNGKYDDEIKKLRELNKQQLIVLENSQQAALDTAVQENKSKQSEGSGTITKYSAGKSETDAESYAASYLASQNILYTLSGETGKAGEKVTAAVETTYDAAKALEFVLDQLEEQGLSSTGVYSALAGAYQEVSNNLNDVTEKEKALAQTKFQSYITEEGKAISDLTLNSFVEWRQGLLELGQDSLTVKAQLGAIARGVEDELKQTAIKDLFADDFSGLAQYLADLASKGELTAETFKESAYGYTGFAEKMNESGLKVNDCVNYFNSYSASADKASNSTSDFEEVVAGLTDDELKALAAGITNAESSISSLNKMMQTLSEGGSLTAEQVMELCDTYGLLASQFTETENGYKIEISALESLRDAQIQTAKVKREEQAYDTLITKNNIIERCRAYGIEISSLANVAEAEAAVIQLKDKMNKNSSGVNSASDGAAAYAKNQELQPILDSIEALRDAYANIDSLADGLYQDLGKSSSKTTSSAKKTDDAFKNLIDSINRLGEMGVYSTSELIDRFEELRRTAGYTAEQIQSIEDELHKLYTTQIEENLKATEQEYKDYVQSVKDKYDEDKEALKSMLDDEKDAFKEAQDDEKDARKEYWSDEIDKLKENLNAQIDSSKAAYEAKKKLTEKSYDNQNEALEKLKDAEISNIKDTYNAQIDALNKIKAARNSERKEEDYQDKRSELLEELSYWEQRTGTDAVEKIADIKKEIADLDRDRKRELEDEDIDNQIDDLEDKRDKEVKAAESAYDAQIAALKSTKTTELEIYETTYKAEQEMLKDKLDKDVKAMEKARDADLKALEKKQKADLKLLEKEQEQKLKALEDEKNAAIKAAEEKWNEIEKIFTDFNISVIASAAEFAPELYNQFHTLFTERFQMDLDEITSSISQMDKAVSNAKSGTRPTGKAANSSSYVSNPVSASGNNSSSGSFKVGSSVKVTGATYTDSTGSKVKIPSVSGEKGSIISVKNGASKPYRIDDLGWVDKSALVKARTGGLTTADGLAMLHKDELIINPELVKGLKAIVDPQMLEGFKKVFRPETYGNVSNNYSSTRNYNNGRNIVFNAPLQNIEKIEDAADMEVAARSIERRIMKKVKSIM